MRILLATFEDIHISELEEYLNQQYGQGRLIQQRYKLIGLEEQRPSSSPAYSKKLNANQTGNPSHPTAGGSTPNSSNSSETNTEDESPPPVVPSFAPDTPVDPLVLEALQAAHPRFIIYGWQPLITLTHIARYLLLDSETRTLRHQFKLDKDGRLVPEANIVLAWVARLRSCLCEFLAQQPLREARLIAELEQQYPQRYGLRELRRARLERAEYFLAKGALFNKEGCTDDTVQHTYKQKWMSVTMGLERWTLTKRLILQCQIDLERLSHSNLQIDPRWIRQQSFFYTCLTAEIFQRQHLYSYAVDAWLSGLDLLKTIRSDIISEVGQTVTVDELETVDDDPMTNQLNIFLQISHCALKIREQQLRQQSKSNMTPTPASPSVASSSSQPSASPPARQPRRSPTTLVESMVLAIQGAIGALAVGQLLAEQGFFLPKVIIDDDDEDEDDDDGADNPKTVKATSSPPSTAPPTSSSKSKAESSTTKALQSGKLPPHLAPPPSTDDATLIRHATVAFETELSQRLKYSLLDGTPYESFLRGTDRNGSEYPRELADVIHPDDGFSPFQIATADLIQYQLDVARTYEQVGRLCQALGKEKEARRAFELAYQGTRASWIEPYNKQINEAY